MRVKVFTVFHRALDQRLIFDQFTQEEADSFFTLYGVNQAHTDKSTFNLSGQIKAPPNLLLEYNLPWHDPTLQPRGFMETSCYVHILKNAIHDNLDYIGIAQYDMRWTPPAAALLRGLARLDAQTRPVVYGLSCGMMMNAQGRVHPITFPDRVHWAFLIRSYNQFFNRNFEPRQLINQPFTLWQTYLMPKAVFAEMAAWLEVLCGQLYPWANQPPYPTHWGLLGGWTERAESLFIAARLFEGQILFEPLPLHHDESIVKKLAITKEQYGSRPVHAPQVPGIK